MLVLGSKLSQNVTIHAIESLRTMLSPSPWISFYVDSAKIVAPLG